MDDKQNVVLTGTQEDVSDAVAPEGEWGTVEAPTVEEVQAIVAEQDEEKKREKVVHIKRFMNGQMTPQDLWTSVVLARMKCFGCDMPAQSIVKVYVPMDVAYERFPDVLLTMKLTMGRIPQVKLNDEPMLAWQRFGCCNICDKQCQIDMARAHSRASWLVVRFERGPDPTNKVVFGFAN